MSAGRQLQPGDEALTDFNDPGPPVRVRILERLEGTRSQSGISFPGPPSAPELPSRRVDRRGLVRARPC